MDKTTDREYWFTEHYLDSTAGLAIDHITHEERMRKKKENGKEVKRAPQKQKKEHNTLVWRKETK